VRFCQFLFNLFDTEKLVTEIEGKHTIRDIAISDYKRTENFKNGEIKPCDDWESLGVEKGTYFVSKTWFY
jgi:hypothetical protein